MEVRFIYRNMSTKLESTPCWPTPAVRSTRSTCPLTSPPAQSASSAMAPVPASNPTEVAGSPTRPSYGPDALRIQRRGRVESHRCHSDPRHVRIDSGGLGCRYRTVARGAPQGRALLTGRGRQAARRLDRRRPDRFRTCESPRRIVRHVRLPRFELDRPQPQTRGGRSERDGCAVSGRRRSGRPPWSSSMPSSKSSTSERATFTSMTTGGRLSG